MAHENKMIAQREQELVDRLAAAQQQNLPQRRCRAIANLAIHTVRGMRHKYRLWDQYPRLYVMSSSKGTFVWHVRFDDSGRRQERILCSDTLTWSPWEPAVRTPSVYPGQWVQ